MKTPHKIEILNVSLREEEEQDPTQSLKFWLVCIIQGVGIFALLVLCFFLFIHIVLFFS